MGKSNRNNKIIVVKLKIKLFILLKVSIDQKTDRYAVIGRYIYSSLYAWKIEYRYRFGY